MEMRLIESATVCGLRCTMALGTIDTQLSTRDGLMRHRTGLRCQFNTGLIDQAADQTARAPAV